MPFGIDEAAHTYFGKAAKDLDLAQAKFVDRTIAVWRRASPNFWCRKGQKQQERVPDEWLKDKISETQRDAALAEAFNLRRRLRQHRQLRRILSR